jgi:hypothetical protein
MREEMRKEGRTGENRLTTIRTVCDEMRRRKVLGVRQRIPYSVIVAVVPYGAILVVLDEEEFIGGIGAQLVDLAVV